MSLEASVLASFVVPLSSEKSEADVSALTVLDRGFSSKVKDALSWDDWSATALT